MERIELGTPDLTQENIQKLGELFPQVLTEVQDENGQVQRAVDFDALRDLLGDVAEETRERYQFTWPGKREAKAEARRPIEKTMRPCPEESVNWDTTENLYIEGDNLDALKILKETYAGKVKMIYIDPPYNTGHDFVYDDDFARTHGEYDTETADYNDEGGRLVANLESNGRFHSDWCSMMYPRLLLARDLLSADGAIFISIDDSEYGNLLRLANDIFGSRNVVATFIWEKKYTRSNDATHFSSNHDYVLCVARDANLFKAGRLPRTDEMNSAYKNPDGDPRGPWKATPLHARSGSSSANRKVRFPNGVEWEPPSGTHLRYSMDVLMSLYEDGRLWFGKNGDAVPSRKTFLSDVSDGGIVPVTIIPHSLGGHNHEAIEETKGLFDGKSVFTSPKPSRLIRLIATLGGLGPDDILVDFFSGSATSAHAIMQLNAEYGGGRKAVMVQLPELCDEDSEAAKAGYANICEIGKERIRRAGAKIKAEVEEANRQLKLGEEPKKVPDIGFRVLKIDSSNFADVMTTPDATSQQMLLDFSDNLKDGRSDMDILFEILPKFEIPYSAKIEEITICGKRCFNVDNGLLIACFDKDVDTDAIEAIAKMQPLYAVMRDASMANDATHANFEELFKTYSPDTIRRVI